MDKQIPLFEESRPVHFAGVDDELGEVCSVCGVDLDDQNRAGTDDEPMCRFHYLNCGFLLQWVSRGGTKGVLEEMVAETPDWLLRDMGVSRVQSA